MHPATSGSWVRPVILEGEIVRLRPLTLDDAPALFAISSPELWRWTLISSMPDLGAMERYVQTALDAAAKGDECPFAIELRDGRGLAGTTRYLEISPEHRTLEIGWTFVATPYQRSRVNTECKRLLLGHAFDVLGARRVQLKTDALNEKSRTAILRLGATFEGILRQHRITDSGRIRDTAYYSILSSEWPEVRARLDGFLGPSAGAKGSH